MLISGPLVEVGTEDESCIIIYKKKIVNEREGILKNDIEQERGSKKIEEW